MSKRGNIRKFGREHIQRTALFKSLATALIEHGQITTTRAKAKSLSTYIEKLITKAKQDTVAVRRDLAKGLGPKAVKKLMAEVAPKQKGRQGGYTRVMHLGPRRSDGAEMSKIEFI